MAECKRCKKVVKDSQIYGVDEDDINYCSECVPNINADDFFTWCQELWETAGNATQIDEDFVNLIYHKLKFVLPELKEFL